MTRLIHQSKDTRKNCSLKLQQDQVSDFKHINPLQMHYHKIGPWDLHAFISKIYKPSGTQWLCCLFTVLIHPMLGLKQNQAELLAAIRLFREQGLCISCNQNLPLYWKLCHHLTTGWQCYAAMEIFLLKVHQLLAINSLQLIWEG